MKNKIKLIEPIPDNLLGDLHIFDFAVPKNKISLLKEFARLNGFDVKVKGDIAHAQIFDGYLEAFKDWLWNNDFEAEFEKKIIEAMYREVHFTIGDNLKSVMDFAKQYNTAVLFSINLPEKSIDDFEKLLKQNKGEIIG